MKEWGGGQFYANINPANEPSRKMFEKLGFRLVQHTYALETGDGLSWPVEKITAREALKRWPNAD
jgi:RimJ/RimL family protein N-acetyltransferase